MFSPRIIPVLLCKRNRLVKSEKFKGGVKSDAKSNYPYFFIGDEAKDPEGVTKSEKKEVKDV